MRLPLCLLALTFSHSSSTAQPQRPLDVNIQSTTLVDALSADKDYTSLLRLLQRARLIPTLNRLNGSTLFAPTNDAIAASSFLNSLAQDEPAPLTDNIQEQLRQQLFYHILNYSIPALPADSVEVHKTLHFPRIPLEPPSQEPPPYPPWMPVPGGSLGGEPQRLRRAIRDDKAWVEVDTFGKGGVQIIKDQVVAANGVIFGINKVLIPPADLAQIISQHPQIAFFNKVLTPEISSRLNSTPALTLFLPTDNAFDKLDPLERLYLKSPFATDDLTRILDMHSVVQDDVVKYSESFSRSTNLTTVDNTTLQVSNETIVALPQTTAEITQADIYASNGVLHIVSSLLIPPDHALDITPEKYLLALNCTKLVSLIHASNLTSLVNDTSTKYTILAPSDEVLSLYGDKDLPEEGSDDLKKMLMYHFLPGKWAPKNFTGVTLVETELREEGLAGGRQVLNIEKHDDSLTFGGVGVIKEHIKVNNTLIYFLTRPLVPPSDPLQVALPLLDLSMYLAAVFSTSLAETLKTTPQTSFLVPHNAAFKRLGLLVVAHLLSSSSESKQDLEQVLLHHVLNTVEYSRTLGPKGSHHTFGTLEGTDIQLERRSDSFLVTPSGGWAGMKSQLVLEDRLTNTGVLHTVSDILIPRTVELTVAKLLKAAQGTTMLSLVNKAGMDWVLNGSAPPQESPWHGMSDAGWTLLCPTDASFHEYNLTELYADLDGLRELVSQHIVPSSAALRVTPGSNNNRPLLLDDKATYSTLLSPSSAYGDISFRKKDDGSNTYIVGIQGASATEHHEDWAQVLSWGRSTTGGGTGGVIQIDRPLIPYHPRWYVEYGGPALVLGLGLTAICGFFALVRVIWRRDVTIPTYAPVGGFENEED